MKIEQLTIYGFGRHTDVTIELGEGITVFYGENEAGKTTIYQFILQILFGFPPKGHTMLRYEPKNGAAYGGKIRLTDSLYGRVEVERVRGKSAGDVTVRMEDGTVAGQEKLTEILRQYDRTAFESIFSFSLFQLQGLEQMDADELSRTLISSGTTGIDVLLQLEKKMEKEKGELFKKSGKNPEMNTKLRELRELESQLKSERAIVDDYEPSVIRLQEVEHQLSTSRNQLQQLQKELDTLKNVKLRIPIEQNRQSILSQLDEIGTPIFPANGIREQELLESKKHETEAKISRSAYQLEALSNEMEQATQPLRLEAIEGLLAKESDWHRLQQHVSNVDAEIRRLKGERQRLLGRLGATDADSIEAMIRADSSLTTEQQLHELASNLQQISRRAESFEVDLQRVDELQQRTIQQIKHIEEQAPTAEEQAQASKWPDVRARLSEAKAYVAFTKEEPPSSSKQMNGIVLAVAVIMAIYGMLQQQWGIVLLGVVIAGISAMAFMKKQPLSTQPDERLQEMKALLKAYEGKETGFEELCERIDDYKRQKEQARRTREEQETTRAMLESERMLTKTQESTSKQQLYTTLSELGLSTSAGIEVIPELFRMIRDLQETEHLLAEHSSERQAILSKIEQQRSQAASVLQREVPEADLYTLVRQEARLLQDAAYSAEAEASQAKELKRTIEEMKLELKAYIEQEQQLFQQANVKDKASYYAAYDRTQEVRTLQVQLVALTKQLEGLPLVDGYEKQTENLEQRVSEIEQRRLEIEQELDAMTDERASLIHKTNVLLSDDAHLRTQQLYENKRAEFNELAFEWSTRQVAAEAIRQTMSELKEKKLPAVLQRANTFFQQLTHHAYTALEIQADGLFQAIRNDRTAFEISELSQATKEQAYVSLRLALADELTEEVPFPMMMDDPFVHFDATRLQYMTALLSTLSSIHQVIVFTCHETLAAHWPDATIIKVSEIGKYQEADVYEKTSRS